MLRVLTKPVTPILDLNSEEEIVLWWHCVAIGDVNSVILVLDVRRREITMNVDYEGLFTFGG